MQNQPAQDVSQSGLVLPFRRKPQARPPARPLAIVPASGLQRGRGADDEFARYEQDRDQPIDERQRMLMNLIAVAIVAVLISIGVWIADTIELAVKQQDCALQGRTNCVPIELPARH